MDMIRTINCNITSNKHHGLTLIELMLVIAIIGVLAAITYPNYSDHIRKGHRKQAMADMAKLQLYLEEQYNNGYVTDAVITNGICNNFCEVDKERYLISATVSNTGYLISAIPKAEKGQNKDTCLGEAYEKLTLSHTGENLPISCWL
ncbi:type IV pilin protein [Vibrio ziniensis]|uniref:Type IV pilin protein n=1 Tax=Vibrio ziniensis TaxID=2711221 RepID=A0A6G7CM64_9VIBR|nr:type IV pilin protein [Vibrio ziniensis]QIH43160.1 type IV pilin protein [Vibrio ziniensis]